MALTGHLSDLSLSELIEFFCNQRKTGSLKVLYPHGSGHFYLQTGSVVDAKIGVLRGIDAVYYALTLPNANFEFTATNEVAERTINQPWTQVVLEGLRRLDEGIEPPEAFPSGSAEVVDQGQVTAAFETTRQPETTPARMPAFLSFMGSPSVTRRRPLVLGAVVVAVLASVAVIGVPAGWYHRTNSAPVPAGTAVSTPPVPTETAVPEPSKSEPVEEAPSNDAAALAAKRQREKERAKAAREQQAAAAVNGSPSPAPVTPTAETTKPGPKKVLVTVTYDESGRVIQASGGDPTALRIARQRRFPPGKGGSATVTIPIN